MEIPVTHIQAWEHFYRKFKGSPGWDKLTAKDKNVLIVADRDSRGERKDKNGKPFGLGFLRVERILKRYAPDVYECVNVRGFIVHENLDNTHK